jgi:cysteine-S-conjugate beta-lyase
MRIAVIAAVAATLGTVALAHDLTAENAQFARMAATKDMNSEQGIAARVALERANGEIEQGDVRMLLVPSGQAALSLILASFLKPGDHVLLPDSVYGPVRAFASSWLRDWGVAAEFYDPLVAAGIAELFRPATRLLMLESPGSNTMEIQDLPAMSAAARRAGVLTVADTTWSTPLHLDALAKGVEITVDALSKYASGHGDVLMGAVGTNSEAHYRRLKDMTRLFGLGVPADDCSLVLRGLQTMPLRVERSSATAWAIAQHLAERPEVEAVLHPALPSDPGHALWLRDFTGASGIFSFLLAGALKGRENDLIDQLKLFAIGASWGSARSIVAPQDPTVGRTATNWTRGKLIRLSIGLEDTADLSADHQCRLDRQVGEPPLPAPSEDRPGVVRHAARHPAIASSDSQTWMSPR